jgi:hypothetical protein
MRSICLTVGVALSLVPTASFAQSERFRSKAPIATYASTKSIFGLEECFINAMNDEHSGWGFGRPVRGEGRTTIIWGHPKNTRMTATLLQGAPSSVEIRVSKTYPDKFQVTLKRCL